MIKALCTTLGIYGLIAATWAGVVMGRDGVSAFTLVTAGFGAFSTAMAYMMHGYISQAELELATAKTAIDNLKARGRA